MPSLTSPNASELVEGLSDFPPPRIAYWSDAEETLGREVIEFAESVGLILDDWQRFVVMVACLLDPADRNRWLAIEFGLVLPRQNGKNGAVEALQLASLFLFSTPLIVHTAHRFTTTEEHFLKLQSRIVNYDALSSRIRGKPNGRGWGITTGNGDMSIITCYGSRMEFLARQSNQGRGFSADDLYLDEAWELPDIADSALRPTLSARLNPRITYLSSSPDQKKHLNARVLARLRERGMAGTARRVAYLEWSIDVTGMTVDERRALRKNEAAIRSVNPGMASARPDRLSMEFVREAEMPPAMSAEGFDVERLGIGDWPTVDDEGWEWVSKEEWLAQQDENSEPDGWVSIGWAVARDSSWAAIGLAGRRADGSEHLELVDCHPRTGWLVPRLLELWEKYEPAAMVARMSTPAAAQKTELEQAGVEVLPMNSQQDAAALTQFYEGLTDERNIWIRPADMLTDAARGAVTRGAGDSLVLDRRTVEVLLAPLEAVHAARWGHAEKAPADYDLMGSFH